MRGVSTVAAQAFPGPAPVNQLCRTTVTELAELRRWLDLTVQATDCAFDTVWLDLLELRDTRDDFDGMPSHTELSIELVILFLKRAGRRAERVRQAVEEARSEQSVSVLAENGMIRQKRAAIG